MFTHIIPAMDPKNCNFHFFSVGSTR
jgi:hypothetical protein